MVTFSLIWGQVLLRSFSVHLRVSGHFNNKWDSLSFPTHRRHLTFSVPPLLAPFSFQNSSRNHAVLLLYSMVDAQLVNKALDIHEIINKILEFNESKFINVFKAVGKYEIFFSTLIHSTSANPIP
jgi:hypothetical protein